MTSEASRDGRVEDRDETTSTKPDREIGVAGRIKAVAEAVSELTKLI